MATEGRTSIKLPPDIKEKLKKEAELQNRSVHNMIITILKLYFARKSMP